MNEVASRAVETAKQVSRENNIPDSVAVALIAQGIVEAAQAQGLEVMSKVQASLPKDVMIDNSAESTKKDANHQAIN